MNKDASDSKTPCKYGENCYQKNHLHHKRFSHPSPKVEKQLEKEETSPPSKKLKLDQSNDSFSTNQDELSEKLTDDKGMSDKDDEGDTDDKSDEEDELIVESPKTKEESIRQKFLVDMPSDFYDFWDFCRSLNKENPEDALSNIGLKLVGPFDILGDKRSKTKAIKLNQYLCHWRFYYDPPEFQTVIVGSTDEYHLGYFRDDPSENPVFVASMSSVKPGIIHPMKEDLFSSLYSYINSDTCKTDEAKKGPIIDKLKSYAKEKGYDLNQMPSARLKERKKKVVAKSFHGAGIVVPFDKKRDVGYREIPETTGSLKRIMKSIDEAPTKEKKEQHFEALQELLTNVQFANDEGDWGMGLELGLDLFAYGSKDFHSSILHLLTVAYDLLNRQLFAKIIKAHLKNRRKGSNLSAFPTK